MFCYFTSAVIFFFFNDTATTEIYTLSLHDALPICSSPCRRIVSAESVSRANGSSSPRSQAAAGIENPRLRPCTTSGGDRKSTRLNSSHSQNSYAVFCLKKKNEQAISRWTHTTGSPS